MPSSNRDDEFAAMLDAFKETAESIGKDVKAVAESWWDEAQYSVDKWLGKELAKHPEFWADARRSMRKMKKAANSFFEQLKDD